MRYVVALTVLAWAAACSLPPPTNKEIQAAKAREAAESLDFASNAEIENIRRRLDLTSQPGLLGYVVLLNESGQPIEYTTVKGKITSSSKRLTSSCEDSVRCGFGPSDEGTYGSSDPYIYFWTSTGAYRQWNGKYLYSDQPFRLSVAPLVINVETDPEPGK